MLASLAYLLVFCAVFFGASAYAQTPGGVANAVCSPDGMQVIEYVAGALIASGAYSCLKKAVAKLPKPVQNALNFVLGDWHQILVAMGVLKA